jgi:hypothetical protein
MQTLKNEMPEAEKFSLISLPLIKNIQWQKQMSEAAGSGLHT